MKIPGIDVQHNTENNVIFNLNPEYKEAVNVTCIADCEIKKSVVTKDYEFKINEIKVISLQNVNKVNFIVDLVKLIVFLFYKQNYF